MKSLMMICALLVSSTTVHAAPQVTRMKVTISFGEKQTVFEIPDTKKLDIIVNGRKKVALRNNIDQAVKLATSASKEKSNDKSLCRRKVIELSYSMNGAKDSKVFGCIDSKTPAATKLTELSNLMLFL